MTRLDALKELAAKVEAGDVDTPDFSAMISRPLMQCKAGEAYRGSLDAALALHNAVLPLSHAIIETAGVAQVSWDKDWKNLSDAEIEGQPARAWLLAILRALIAQEKGK